MCGLPATAVALQEAGITVLLYDPRGVGLSDGFPRNDINPFREIDDLSDALSFLSGHPAVDPELGVGMWGMSLGAATAMCAAALDPRCRFVVAVGPATEFPHKMSKLPAVLSKAAKDRESRLKGNEPFYVPLLSAQGENPAGFNVGQDKDAAMRMLGMQDVTEANRAALAPNHVNRTTVNTYRYLLLWDPGHMWKYLDRTPVMMVVAANDELVGRDVMLRHFETLPGPKRLHIEEGVGHMDILEGENRGALNELQAQFIHSVMKGEI
jgi:pimeloyl-ACP methyl ester carboxylesterase